MNNEDILKEIRKLYPSDRWGDFIEDGEMDICLPEWLAEKIDERIREME